MTDQERQAIMTLAIMAAFADDRKDAAERDQVKRIADSLSRDSELNVAAVYQDVLLKRVTLESAVAALASPEASGSPTNCASGSATRTARRARRSARSSPPCSPASGSMTRRRPRPRTSRHGRKRWRPLRWRSRSRRTCR